MEQQTSRNWILDAVELAGQLMAENSHLQEIQNSYGENPDVSEEDRMLCSSQIIVNNSLRRKIMEEIGKGWDHKYRCATKHAIFAYELACEVLYANPNNTDIQEIQDQCSKNMYAMLSKFMGMEMVMCGRCFDDALNEKQAEEVI